MAQGPGRTFRQNILNWIFGKGSPTTPAGVIYVSLHTADPGVDGQTSNEATGTGYARVATSAATWNNPTAAEPSVVTNAADVSFAQAGGDWSAGASMTYCGYWTSLSGTTAAEFIGRGPATPNQAVLNGNTATFPATQLSFSLNQT